MMKMCFKRFLGIAAIAIMLLALSVNKLYSQDLNEALKLIQGERYEDAEEIFKKVIQNNPNNGDAYFYYGECILKNYVADPFSNSLIEVAKESNSLFNKGLKADSTNALNLVGLGMVVLLQKNDTTAADIYFRKAELSLPKKAKNFKPNNLNVLVKLGSAQLYANNPRYNKAVAYMERAKEVAPTNADVFIATGDVYLDQNKASEAVANYNKAVYLNPKLVVPKVKIGHLYMRSRNLQEARNYFDQAKEIDSTYAPLYRAYGEMYSMGGLANLSKSNFKKFLDLSDNNIPAKVQYINSLFKAKDYKECVANIEDVLNYDKSRNYLYRIAAYSCYEMRPGDYAKGRTFIETFFKNTTPEKIITRDYSYYGRILLKLKDTSLVDLAFEKLITAYNVDTTDFDLLSDIATNAYFNKRFELAVEMLNKKINAGKANTNDYMYLGKTHYQMAQLQKTDTAIQNVQYRKALDVFNTVATKIEPTHIQAYLWMANTGFSIDPESKMPETKQRYELVVEKASADTVKNAKELFEAYSYLGSFYLFAAKPDYEKAEYYYLKILTLDPKNNNWKVKAYNSLGIIDTKRKRYPSAISWYKKVMEIEPKNESVQKTIEGIKKAMTQQ